MKEDVAKNYFVKKFIAELEPIRNTHQAALRILKTKDGRQFVGKMSSSPIKKWIKDFMFVAEKHKPDVPFTGPLEVTFYFAFPLIKSDKGKPAPMTTKPDFDNLCKSVCDAMTKLGFWTDDSQITFGKVMKFRNPVPYVGVEIKPANYMDKKYFDAVENHLRT
jgi:Holliday junction resolvase RusA-like endonuclease